MGDYQRRLRNPIMRYKPGQCCCNDCVVYSTDFDWAGTDPFIYLNGVTHGWSFIPSLSGTFSDFAWYAQGGGTPWLGCRGTYGTAPYRALLLTDAPRHLKFRIKIAPQQKSQVVNITYTADTLGGGPDDKRYKLKLEFTDHFKNPSDPRVCGYASFWDTSDLLSPVQIGPSIPIPGLDFAPGNPHTVGGHDVSLCYNPETKILSAIIVNIYGEEFSLHAHEIETPADPLDHPQVWIEVENFGTTYLVSNPEVRFIDPASLSQTKNLPNEFNDYGYAGVGDSESENCPCCRPPGCESVSVPITDPLDCRFHVSSGSIAYDSDVDGPYFVLTSSGARVQFQSSWSGTDSDCLPDRTFYVTQSIRITGFSANAMVDVAYFSSGSKVQAKLTSESTLGAADGTLKIYDSSGTELDSVTLIGNIASSWITVKVCYDGRTLKASAMGKSVEGLADDPGGPFVGWENSGGTYVDIKDVVISHDIYSQECPDCFDETVSGLCPDESNCIDDIVADDIRLLITGNINPAQCASSYFDVFSGSYILSPAESGVHPSGTLCNGRSFPGQCIYFWNTGTTRDCIVYCNEFGNPVEAFFTIAVYKLDDGYYLVGSIYSNVCGVEDGSPVLGAAFLSDKISDNPLDCVNGFDGIVLHSICHDETTNFYPGDSDVFQNLTLTVFNV